MHPLVTRVAGFIGKALLFAAYLDPTAGAILSILLSGTIIMMSAIVVLAVPFFWLMYDGTDWFDATRVSVMGGMFFVFASVLLTRHDDRPEPYLRFAEELAGIAALCNPLTLSLIAILRLRLFR